MARMVLAAVAAFALAGSITLDLGRGGPKLRATPKAHAHEGQHNEWLAPVPLKRANSKGKMVHCADCKGRCGGNITIVDPLCAKLALPAESPCGGHFGLYLNALTGGCKKKKFNHLFKLDGFTFGIRNNYARNMPTLLQFYVDEDRALVEQVFRDAGVNRWLRGGKVQKQWFLQTQTRYKGLYCHDGFRRAMERSTTEPAFLRAQIKEAYAKLLKETDKAKGFFSTTYGRIAWAVIGNNKGSCKLTQMARQCRRAGDEIARVECFIDLFVEKKCRGNRKGSLARAKVIRAAFPTRALRSQPFSLTPVQQTIAQCAGDDLSGATAAASVAPVASPPPVAPQVEANGEPRYCDPAQWERFAVDTGGLGGKRYRLKAFRVGRVVLAGMGVGEWSKAKGAAGVKRVARRFARSGNPPSACTWYLHRKGRSPQAAKAFHHHYVSFPDRAGDDPPRYLRALRRAFGGGRGSFLACARDHGFIGLGGNRMEDRGLAVWAMILAYSGCSPDSAVTIARKLWGKRVKRRVGLAIARAAARLGRQNHAGRAALAALFTGPAPTRRQRLLKRIGAGLRAWWARAKGRKVVRRSQNAPTMRR